MPKILFRADSNKKIGTGDLVSFIYLSHKFKKEGWECYFAVRDSEAAKQIAKNWHLQNVYWIPNNCSIKDEIRQIKKLCFCNTVDCFFIQITEFPLREYKDLKRVAPIMACVNFDGFIFRDFNLVVNWGVDLKDTIYKDYKKGNFLCGFENTVLPDYFDWEQICKKRPSMSVICRILIAMGGIDEFNLIGRILDALENFDNELEIRVIIGPGCRLNDKDRFRGVVFKENSCNLFEDYLWADIAFSAGGLTSSELVATQTPAILISSYAHQIRRCQYYACRGWAYYLGEQHKLGAGSIRNGLDKVLGGFADYKTALAGAGFRGANEKIFEIIDSYR